jgi:hypothetical protein
VARAGWRRLLTDSDGRLEPSLWSTMMPKQILTTYPKSKLLPAVRRERVRSGERLDQEALQKTVTAVRVVTIRRPKREEVAKPPRCEEKIPNK